MKRLLSISHDNFITSIVIGKFDGLHRAHRQLFSYLDDQGAIIVIQMNSENLTPGEVKQEFSSYPIYKLEFPLIKDLSGEQFFLLLQDRFPNLRKIIVGYDFKCGKDRTFEAKDIQKVFKGEVKIIPEIRYKGQIIHSTDIRKLLLEGNIRQANEFLGRAYMIEGTIIKGQGIGSKELVPTINLEVQSFLIPKEGVYCTYTQFEKDFYNSITFVGNRVTTDHHFAIETHLLAPKISSYIQTLPHHASLSLNGFKLPPKARVYFLEYLRMNQKFSSLNDLKEQIHTDLIEAKDFHNKQQSLFYNTWFAKES